MLKGLEVGGDLRAIRRDPAARSRLPTSCRFVPPSPVAAHRLAMPQLARNDSHRAIDAVGPIQPAKRKRSRGACEGCKVFKKKVLPARCLVLSVPTPFRF